MDIVMRQAVLSHKMWAGLLELMFGQVIGFILYRWTTRMLVVHNV